eukprot:COSAG05_NODE_2026_length_3672_cov_18.472152_2_plen_604_part_00
MFGSVDFSLFIPCFPVSYYSRFFANSFITPACLLCLVALSWTLDRPPKPEGVKPTESVLQLQARRTAKKSDFYFAFFLCYPTVSKTFFDHFDCRRLSQDESILNVDNRISCEDSTWYLFAVFAALGLTAISFGAPLYFLYKMHTVMTVKIHEVQIGQKKKVVAYNEFGRQFDYVAGNFRAEAWFTEPIDLIKKLLLSGMIIFIKPGTVVQCTASITISLSFTILHAYIWPYPHNGANWLKLITEVQVVMVMGTTLIFRFEDEQLEHERFEFIGLTADKKFYQHALQSLLVGAVVSTMIVLARPSKNEKAQRALIKLASKDLVDLEGSATTPESRERVRIAIRNMKLRISVSMALNTAGNPLSIDVPTSEQIFQQIDTCSEPRGSMTSGEIRAWWITAEPASSYTAKGKPVIIYSRLQKLREVMIDELLIESDNRIERDEFDIVLETLMARDFEIISDASLGRKYYMNTRSRQTMWNLPTVDEWLAELHNLRPPQLVLPVRKVAVQNKTFPPPLFGNPGPSAPAVAAHPLTRSPTDEETEAEVTANPLGLAQEERQQEAQQNEWEENRSTKHGNRVYWVNKRTRESTWKKPRELARDDDDKEWM